MNARNDRGETPLHCASGDKLEDLEQMVRVLIEHHADVNATDNDGRTMLD